MSLVAASEDDTSDQNGKPSTPAHLTSSTSTIITTRENLHLAITSLLRMLHLPCNQQFCLGLNRTAFFPVQFCFFEFEYVQTCFVFIFHLCVISSSMCSHRLSRANHRPFFSCLAGAQFADHITCLAPAVLFQFEHTIASQPIHLFHTHTHIR